MKRLAVPAFALLLLGASSVSHAAWSTNPWQNNPVSLAPGNQRQPGMTPDGSGGAFIVFRDTRDSASLGTDIYAQHLDPQGNPLWAANGVPVAAYPLYQGMQGLNPSSIVIDGKGGAFVTFFTLPSVNGGSFSWLKLQHLDASGAEVWGDSGIAVSPYSAVGGPLLADGMGGMFLCWLALPPGNLQVMVQHFDASGSPLWNPGGVLVCTTSNAGSLDMVSDGSGGVVLAWTDFRVPCINNCHVYARRVDAAGVPQWAADGIALSTIPGQQLGVKMCRDGGGGAFV